jgi:hypothetical protein
MEVTSPAWTQGGRLHTPPKSAFKHAFIIIIIWMLKVWRNTELWIQGPGFISTQKEPHHQKFKVHVVCIMWGHYVTAILLHIAKLGKQMWICFLGEILSCLSSKVFWQLQYQWFQRLWSFMFFMYTLHKMCSLVLAITLYWIFDLFAVGGSSQTMSRVYLWPPTQHQVKGLKQVDQMHTNLKDEVKGHQQHICCHVSGIYYSHYMGSVLLSLPGREKSSLWKVTIIQTKRSYITPTELLWSFLSRHNTNFSPIVRNAYCKLLGPSRYKAS